MKLMVPTLWCEAMLTMPLSVAGKNFAAGELVSLPYGVVIQAIALGTITVIKNADAVHAEATEMLAQYGPDSWFPQPIQTIAKLGEWMAEQHRLKTDENVPRNASGDTIH